MWPKIYSVASGRKKMCCQFKVMINEYTVNSGHLKVTVLAVYTVMYIYKLQCRQCEQKMYSVSSIKVTITVHRALTVFYI